LAAGLAGAILELRRPREPIAWRCPEYWSLGLSALAWLPLTVVTMGSDRPHQHLTATAVGSVGSWSASWGHPLLAWSLMVVAMMPPLAIAPLRVTASRSLWARRDRAVACFMFGFLGLWLLTGTAAVGFAALATHVVSQTGLLAATGFGIAAAWQLTPAKARAIVACHATAPLSLSGWRADLDCVRYGWRIGKSCLVSCWAMMTACVLAGHGLVAAVCIGVVAISERTAFRPNQRLFSATLGGLALLYATGLL